MKYSVLEKIYLWQKKTEKLFGIEKSTTDYNIEKIHLKNFCPLYFETTHENHLNMLYICRLFISKLSTWDSSRLKNLIF